MRNVTFTTRKRTCYRKFQGEIKVVILTSILNMYLPLICKDLLFSMKIKSSVCHRRKNSNTLVIYIAKTFF